jgi:hypothetical protein
MPRITLPIVFGTLMLSACVNSTQMVATWKDPGATGLHPTRTLAVFMSKEPGMRRMVEDKLAQRLPGGIPSYKVIPDEQIAGNDSLRNSLKSLGFDAVVIMRLVGVTTQTTAVSGGPDFYGYWRYWGAAYDPVYYETSELYSVESTMYAMSDGRLVWMGRSQTVDPKNSNKLADYSVNFVVKNLKRQGITQ